MKTAGSLDRLVSACLMFIGVLFALVAVLAVAEWLTGVHFSLMGSRMALFLSLLVSAFFAGQYRWLKLADHVPSERVEVPEEAPVEAEPVPETPRRRTISASAIAERENAVPAPPIRRPVPAAKASVEAPPAEEEEVAETIVAQPLTDMPGDIDMADAEHVIWVKAQRDPALWHLAAMAAFAYRGDPHDFLPWVLAQPETDRATAGWMFLWAEGSRYLRGETDFPHRCFTSEQVVALLEALCLRGKLAGFENDALGLDEDFEPEREACVDLIAKGQVADGIVAPVAVIGQPFELARVDRRFVLDDGLIVSR